MKALRRVWMVWLLLGMVVAATSSVSAQAVDFNAVPIAPGVSDAAFVGTGGTLQTFWTPAQLSAASGLLTHVGLQFATPVSRRWQNVRITVGETTNTFPALSATFAANFNAGLPPVVCYNGPARVTTTLPDQIFRIPLTTVYSYSGVNNLCVIFETTGEGVGSGFPALRTQIQGPGPFGHVSSPQSPAPATGSVLAGLSFGGGFTFMAQTPGTAIRVASCDFVGGMAVVGANTVTMTLQNVGTLAVTFTMSFRYSLDLGATWSAQSFQASGFTPLTSQVLTFAQPAIRTTITNIPLTVEMFPSIGPAVTVASKVFVPDLDIAVPASSQMFALNTPQTVTVTLKNHGDWSLNGQALPLRYTTGAGFTNQTAIGATLATYGATQAFAFTTPVVFTTPGSYTLTASVFPVLPLDPDPVDVGSLALPYVGLNVAGDPAVAPITSPPPVLGSGPFFRASGSESANTVLFSHYYPAWMIATLPIGARIQGLSFLKQYGSASTSDNSLRVWLRNHAGPQNLYPQGATFANVLSGASYSTPANPATLMLNTATFRIPEGAGSVPVGPFNPANIFLYTGGALEVITEWSCNGALPFAGTTGPLGWPSGPYEDPVGGLTTNIRSLCARAPGGPPLSPGTMMVQGSSEFLPGMPRILIHHEPWNFPLSVTSLQVQSGLVRPSGQIDVYRGQVGVPVALTLANLNPSDAVITGLTFTASPNPGIGFSVSVPALPVTIPANTPSFPLTAFMDLPGGSLPFNGVATLLTVTGVTGTAMMGLPVNPPLSIVPHPPAPFTVLNPPLPIPVTSPTTTLNPAVHGVPYLMPLVASGGTGSYIWSLHTSSPQLIPDGLALNGSGSTFLPASLSGTPSINAAVGNYSLVFEVYDGLYMTLFPMTIQVATLAPLVFPTVTLPPATEFLPYTTSQPLSASGGSLIYVFTVDPATPQPLPSGLLLDPATGVISGTPANGTQGTHTVMFSVDDGRTQLTQLATIVVMPHVLQWRSTTVPDAVRTVVYNHALDAIGGTGPRIFTVQSGTLPPGLALNPANGVLAGVPTTEGAYPVSFRVTDGLNAGLTQGMVIQVNAPDPLLITPPDVPVVTIGTPLSLPIAATGGSLTYTFSLLSGGVQPGFVSITPAGMLSVVAGALDEGVSVAEIAVNDGFQIATLSIQLRVVQIGAPSLAISELDIGTGYLELANMGTLPVDMSAWGITLWVDSTSPVSMPLSALPGASVALPGDMVSIFFGGTAGGAWPSYSTGGAFNATLESAVAVLLSDAHGTPVAFLRTSGVTASALLDLAAAPVWIPSALMSQPPLTPAAANFSLTPTGYLASTTGSPGMLNPGFSLRPLSFFKANLRDGVAGETYADVVMAMGGVPPYSYSITTGAASSWMSMAAATGVVSGTVPVGSTSTVTVDVSVTDSTSATITLTRSFTVWAPTVASAGSLTVGHVASGRGGQSIVTVPLLLSRTSPSLVIDGMDFHVESPAAGALELLRVLPGPALIASGYSVAARALPSGRVVVTGVSLSGTAAPISDGVVALLQYRVTGPSNSSAPAGLYAVQIGDVSLANSVGPGSVVGQGSIDLSDFSPRDANRDAAIDVVDVQVVVNLILSLSARSFPSQGDANVDGSVDVVDVQAVVNKILNP